MAAFLDEIVAATRCRVARSKSAADLRALERQAATHVPRGFRRALAARSQEGIAVIAELKKASPSKGLIRADFSPVALAGELEKAGAAALSVLTDEEFFQGSLENLQRASAAVAIPCLRKDFIVDEFQLLEARANAADAVLLIVATAPADEPQLTCEVKFFVLWSLKVPVAVNCEVVPGATEAAAVITARETRDPAGG